jgi:hypothetical protein
LLLLLRPLLLLPRYTQQRLRPIAVQRRCALCVTPWLQAQRS